MNKKELLDTPEIKPTNDMIKALAERVQGWRNESVAKYKMAIRVKKITGEQIYKIAVFKAKQKILYLGHIREEVAHAHDP